MEGLAALARERRTKVSVEGKRIAEGLRPFGSWDARKHQVSARIMHLGLWHPGTLFVL